VGARGVFKDKAEDTLLHMKVVRSAEDDGGDIDIRGDDDSQDRKEGDITEDRAVLGIGGGMGGGLKERTIESRLTSVELIGVSAVTPTSDAPAPAGLLRSENEGGVWSGKSWLRGRAAGREWEFSREEE